jgi:putative resolvase
VLGVAEMADMADALPAEPQRTAGSANPAGANSSDFRSHAWITNRWQIANSTLQSWANSGRLPVVRFPSGKRLYSVSHLQRLLGVPRAATGGGRVVYARVSSRHQDADLERQIADLQAAYPDHEVVSDIASGINFHRKGLTSIIDRAIRGELEEVVVMHRDRLARFAFDLIEHVLQQSGVRLVVHSRDAGAEDARDLADDLLAITTVFVASHNGRRAAENRRQRKRLAQEEAGEDT